ncbi:hypothetical protein [Paraburkholderia sp. RL17-347-BIC-D]
MGFAKILREPAGVQQRSFDARRAHEVFTELRFGFAPAREQHKALHAVRN